MRFGGLSNQETQPGALAARAQTLKKGILLLSLFALQGCFPMYLASQTVKTGASAAASIATKAVVLTAGAVTAVVSKAVETATDDRNDDCVSRDTRIGDKVTLPDGSSAVVKTLSGASTRCPDPNTPVQAHLEPAP